MSASAPANSAAEPNPQKRRGRLIALAVVVLLGLAGYGFWWYSHARFFADTDDAYVASDLIQITNQVGGTVLSVTADDTQHVARGQLLVELDPADARVAVAEAEAELARSVRSVRSLFAQSQGLQAQIRERQVALETARANLKRRQAVAAEGGVSAEELQHARDEVAQLSAALDVSRQSLHTTEAQIADTDVDNNPQVLAAAARLRDAALALRRTKIYAPVSGTVARRSIQVGTRIAAGTPLMAVVPLDAVWVDANFKEVQLSGMRVGQPVSLFSDLYGSDVVYHGKLVGLGAGSGAAFAVLPAQNASGNWIKIVQRVPVRIALDPTELAQHPLRVGLSMTAEVDLHDDSGSIVATQVRQQPQAVLDSQYADPEIEARISDIIERNAGARAQSARLNTGKAAS